MYIGEQKIKGTLDQGDGFFQVGFTDNSPDITISKELLKAIKTKKKGRGNVVDNINHYYATKFLNELAKEGFDYYMVDNIAMAMRTLAHNMREELIKSTFDCGGADDISLKTIIDNMYGSKEGS